MAYGRRVFLKHVLCAGVVAGAAMLVPVSNAFAHHGWRWAEDGNFEITGDIISAKLGNPHGLVYLNVNGERWTIEVGQPWRNDRAGLTDAHFAAGNEITISGHRSKDPEERLVKAERVIIDGKTYDLYPERG
ncbi:MAG: twin-arginine translocation signal domain-containing protein [Rhodospirillales bacterium]|nr:twin-arginine translocation signal domain-containing protein [Rhodospirillales bacterium]MBO6788270.1 twin-arginine translocation signal domain-containing protein [Rhodospirillales bacterium]